MAVHQPQEGVSFEPDGVELPEVQSELVDALVPGPFTTIDLHLGQRPTEVSMLR